MIEFVLKIALFTGVLPTLVPTALAHNDFLHVKGKVGTLRARSGHTPVHAWHSQNSKR